MAENLIPSAVGKDRTVPGHESMQPPEPLDSLIAGPQKQMVSIRKDNAGIQRLQNLIRHCLYGSGCADRHEDRSRDIPVGGMQYTASGICAGILMQNFKSELRIHKKICLQSILFYPQLQIMGNKEVIREIM
jgi:hypothetical protein